MKVMAIVLTDLSAIHQWNSGYEDVICLYSVFWNWEEGGNSMVKWQTKNDSSFKNVYTNISIILSNGTNLNILKIIIITFLSSRVCYIYISCCSWKYFTLLNVPCCICFSIWYLRLRPDTHIPYRGQNEIPGPRRTNIIV